MLKKQFIEQINNENHYTIPKYVLTHAKDFNLDVNSLILLIYFLNQKNKDIFNYKKIIEDLNFSEKELFDSISLLKDKKLISIQMEKNDSGVLEEKLDVSSFYDIILSKFINESDEEEENSSLYDSFEREFGRTLSPMEYDIINSWLEAKIDKGLIIEALKETVFNGVSNLRYVDKILYEWNKKGIKKPSDINRSREETKDDGKEEYFEYDWLNE